MNKTTIYAIISIIGSIGAGGIYLSTALDNINLRKNNEKLALDNIGLREDILAVKLEHGNDVIEKSWNKINKNHLSSKHEPV